MRQADKRDDDRKNDPSSLAELTRDPKNARKHTPRNVGMIEDALQEVGAARSIVIDEDNVVLAGNATIEAAGNVGIEKVRVIDAEGDEIIAVRRTGLTKRQKTRLALFDNRTAELAEWEPEVISDLEPDDLAGMFTGEELSDILGTPPDFAPVGEDEQGRLDQKKPVTCPQCGHEFTT